MNNINKNFIFRNFYRDLRAGNLTLLLFSLIVAIGSISCISFLSDRVKQSLDKDIESSLGSDRRIVSDRPIPGDWFDLADQLGISWAQGNRFPSMIVHNDSSKLVSIKAVTDNYPLKGQLEIETSKGLIINPELKVDGVWIDPSLVSQLKIEIGDEIFVGDKKLNVNGIIVYEPDRGINFVNFAPRVFINYQILPETGLIQTGSRVSYRLWLTSDDSQKLAKFDEFISKNLGSGQRVDTVDSARPDLNEALEKANSFLSLIGMITILMSAVTIALASRELANSQKKGFALMQALGCDFGMLRKIAISELTLTLFVGVFFGCLVGFISQLFLGWFLVNYSNINLPNIEMPSLWVFFQALVIAVLLVITFSWPSFHRVFNANPAFTLRMGQQEKPKHNFFKQENFLSYLILISGMLIMLYVITKNLEMALLVSLGFIVMAMIFFILCFAILKFISYINLNIFLKNFTEFNWVWLNFKRAAKRRGLSIAAQIIGLGLSIAALSTSALIQNDLVKAWKNLLPQNAPNNFVINIQNDQKSDFKKFLESYNIIDFELYPMVKARLIKINNKKLLPQNFKSLSTRRLLKREINLSYGEKIPTHNKIYRGEKLDPKRLEVSVERGFAKNFDIQLGDLLSFDVAGEEVNVTVTSIRSLKWESMQINFFMFLSEKALKEKPQSAITAFYLNNSANSEFINSTNNKDQFSNLNFKNELLKQFNNLTIVDTDLLVKQVRRLITQSVFAVQFLFIFCLISGCLVMWASLLSSREERIKEVILFRSLGASTKQLLATQMFELMLIGVISGFLATAMSQILAKLVASKLFEINLILSFYPLMIGSFIGATFALVSGAIALRGIVSSSTVNAIRKAS